MRSLLAALAFCLVPTGALADGSVASGSACNAILPGQSQQLEWRATGLINPSPTRDFFVICPMDRQTLLSDGDSASQRFWGGAVVVSALEDAVGESTISCQVREVVGGTRVGTRSETIALAAGEQGILVWTPRAVRDETLSSFHASCRLPPKTAVNTVVSVSSANGDASLLQQLGEAFNDN